MPDLPSWWSDGGAPGWSFGTWLGTGLPWTLAGLSLGGWSLEEPGRAPLGPFPGVSGVQSPIVWYDSVAVGWGEGAAWRGFGAALGTATGRERLAAAQGARTVVDLRNGSFGYDENSLSIERGDSLAWFRGEASSGNRGVIEPLEDQGRHVWGVSGGLRRGRHAFEATFSQRAASGGIHSLDIEDAGGQSGSLGYHYEVGSDQVDLVLARGLDHRTSSGLSRDPSRRDAQQTTVSGELRHRWPDQELGVRVEWSRASVNRTFERSGDYLYEPDFERGSDVGWVAGRWDRPMGQGRLRLELGAGSQAALGSFEMAPGISYRVEADGYGVRAGLERVLFPVWADLAQGQPAFLQRTWAGSFEVHAGQSLARRVGAVLLLGRTLDRALVTRMPLDDLWLRLGATADPSPYDFALLMLEARWRGGPLALGGSGFGLARRQNAALPALDPGWSGVIWAGTQFDAFQGDLGVRVRAQLEGVGRRDSQGAPYGLLTDGEVVPSRSLPGYLTSGVTFAFRLAHSVITIRVRNLENRRREEIWFDSERFYVQNGELQVGREALGPGREWRFALTARLSN